MAVVCNLIDRPSIILMVNQVDGWIGACSTMPMWPMCSGKRATVLSVYMTSTKDPVKKFAIRLLSLACKETVETEGILLGDRRRRQAQ